MNFRYASFSFMSEGQARPFFENLKARMNLIQKSPNFMAANNDDYALYFDYDNNELIIEALMPEVTEEQIAQIMNGLLS